MKRLPLFLALGLSLLTACGSEGVPRDDVATLSPGTTTLAAQTPVTVKLRESSWTVTGAPAWLTVTQETKNGATYFTFTAAALEGTAPDAQAPELRALVSITGDRGRYAVNVTVPLTPVRGQVPPTPAAPTRAAPGPTRVTPVTGPGRIVVQWRDQPALTTLGALVREQRAGGVTTQVLNVPDVQAALQDLKANAQVWRAFPETRMRAAQSAPAPWTPGDALAAYQWQMPATGYGAVLADGTGRYPTPVTVAVIDTGVRAAHPDLAGRVLGSADGAIDLITDPANGDGDGPDLDPTDPGVPGGGSHGTAVTGLIVAARNSVGIAGGTLDAPVQVQPIRVLGSSSDGDTTEIMLAVRYAAGETVQVGGKTLTNPRPAQIINLSLGASGRQFTEEQKAFICEAVSAAARRGALVVAAAGNSGMPDEQYPAACADAVAVGAVTVDAAGQWVHAPYSASGRHVRLSAPGGSLSTTHLGLKVNGAAVPDGILTTTWETGAVTGSFDMEEGTSFATPQVSAAAALLLSKGVTKTAAATAARLVATATDVGTPGRDDLTGTGVLNVAAALGLTGTGTGTAPGAAGQLVTVRAATGREFRPVVQASGAWTAYLAPGNYVVTQGVDADGSGTLEGSEVRREESVSVTAGTPVVLN